MLAGLLLGLAISYKVTPALFFLYFAYKRSWRTVGGDLAGPGHLPAGRAEPGDRPAVQLRVPCACGGTACSPRSWSRASTSPQEINQSMVGVLTRLLTEMTPGTSRYDLISTSNLVSLAAVAGRLPGQGACGRPGRAAGVFCRTKTQRPSRPPAPRRNRPGRADDALRLGAELEASLRDALAPLHLSCLGVLFPAEEFARPAWPSVLRLDFRSCSWRPPRASSAACSRAAGARDRAGLRDVPLGRGRTLRRGGLVFASEAGARCRRAAGGFGTRPASAFPEGRDRSIRGDVTLIGMSDHSARSLGPCLRGTVRPRPCRGPHGST